METTRTTKVRFSAKTFAKGVAKSTGAAITATLTEHTPFIASTLQDTMSTASEAATFVKENNPFRRNKNKDPLLRKIINESGNVFNQVRNDVFEGDLSFQGTNKMIADFSDKYSDDSWDDDNPFADFEEGSDNDNPFGDFNAKTYADGIVATATAITQSSQLSSNAIISHNYKALNAASNKMIAANLANYAKINMQMSSANNNLNTINNNIISLVEFNNTTMNNYIRTMTEHVAKQQAFMTNMTEMLTKLSNHMTGTKEKDKYAYDPEENNFLKDGFNIKKFFKNIAEDPLYGQGAISGINILSQMIFGKSSKFFKEDLNTMDLNGIVNSINPIQLAISALFPSLKKFKKVDKSINNFSKIFFAKAKEGKLGGIFQGDFLKEVMKIIGYKSEYLPSGFASYNKEATPWTGKDSMSLQTVIPSYLSSIDVSIKDMEDSVVGAIRSVNDTITLYGEMYRTGIKSLNHTDSGDGRYTTREFKDSEGRKYSTLVSDYSNDYKNNRKNVRQYFDYDSGIFTNSTNIIEEERKNFARMIQNTFEDAFTEIGKVFKESTASNDKMKEIKDELTDILYNFDQWDSPETFDESEVNNIIDLIKSANSNVSDKQLHKIINALNSGRIDLGQNYNDFVEKQMKNSNTRLFSSEIFYGNDDAKAKFIEDAKRNSRIKFMSADDLFEERVSNMSPEELARTRREREERERRRRLEERQNSLFGRITDFLGIDNVNEHVGNFAGRVSDTIDSFTNSLNDNESILPSFNTGALKIDRDKIVRVHKGEIILPPDTSEAVRKNIEDFINGRVSELDEATIGKATTEQLKKLLKKKNAKKLSGVAVATHEMWDSDEIQNSHNPFEFLVYKVDEIGENIKIIGNNAIDKVKQEANDLSRSKAANKLVGDTNEAGYKEGGLLSNPINRLLSAKNKALHSVFGTKYTDLDSGEEIAEDKDNSFAGKYKNWLKESADKISSSIGVSQENKERIKSAADFLSENTDKLLIGGATGFLAKALLGVSFGPLIGVGGAIALSQDKIKAKLFGSKNKDGTQNDDGLIKQKTQKFFKDNAFKLITGGLAGMLGMGKIRNGVLGKSVSGVLGGLSNMVSILPGGGIFGGALNAITGLAMSPLAGALIGVGSTALLQTDAVKNVLFGEEKEVDGKKVRDGGIVGGLKKSLGKVTDAVATSILGDKVKMTDEDGNETIRRRGGIIEKLKNAVNVHLIGPIVDTGEQIKDNFVTWFKFDVLGSLKSIVSPITIKIEQFADGLVEGGKSIANGVAETIKKAFSPVTKAIANVGDAMFELTLGSVKGAAKLSLGLASAPLKMLAAVMNIGNAREKMKFKWETFKFDFGIFKNDFDAFKDNLAKIWLGDDYKEKIQARKDAMSNSFIAAKQKAGQFISGAKDAIKNDPRYIAITNGMKDIKDFLANTYKKDIKPKLQKILEKISPFFDKVGKVFGFLGKGASTLFNKIFGGLGERIKHPFSSLGKDVKQGYDKVNEVGKTLSDKFHGTKLGRTMDLFGNSFKSTKQILSGITGIGIKPGDITDKNIKNEEWYNNYMQDKSAFVDTYIIEHDLDELQRNGIHTIEDKRKAAMYKKHLAAAQKIQSKTSKLQKKLSKKYGYADADFDRLSEDEKNNIRKQISKVTGKDTSNWTTEDLANFAHRSKAEADKQKEEAVKKEAKEAKESLVQETVVALPNTLEEQHKSLLEVLKEHVTNIIDAIHGNTEATEQTSESIADVNENVAESVTNSIEEVTVKNREVSKEDEAKKARDAKEALETKQAQALGNSNGFFSNPVSDTDKETKEGEDKGLFNDENYNSTKEGKKGILSGLVGGVGKILGGAGALVKGGIKLLTGNVIPIAAIAGTALLWPVIKKLPWDKIVGAIPKLVGGAASALVKGVGTLITEVVPTVVSAVVTNIPDMISSLTTGIVDGVKLWWQEKEEKKQENSVIVNAEGEISETDIMDTGSNAIEKGAKAVVMDKVTKSALKTTSENVIGQAHTSKIITLANKIKEFLKSTFQSGFKKHRSNKVGKSKIINKLASKTGTSVREWQTLSDTLCDKMFKKFDDIVKYITKDNIIARKFSALMDKIAKKFGKQGMSDLIESIAPVVKIATTIWDAAWGVANVERYFHLQHEKWNEVGTNSDALMRTIAGCFNVAENFLPGIGLVITIFFDAIAEMSITNTEMANSIGYDGDLRCRICSDLYIAMSNDENKRYELKMKQMRFVDEKNAYNEKFGTNINTTQLARSQNMFVSEKIFDGDSEISADWQDQDASSVPDYLKQQDVTDSTQSANHNNGGFGNGEQAVGYGGHFTQNDPRWSKMPYGRFRNGRRSTIGAGGCGPTSLANAINNVSGAVVTNPARIARFASKNGYGVDGGTSAGLFNNAGQLGVSSRTLSTNASSITSQLKSGHNVIVSGKGGNAYTSAGHILNVKGLDSRGNAVVDDPLVRGSRHIPMNKLTRGMTHAWSIGRGRRRPIGFGTIDDGSGDNFATIYDFTNSSNDRYSTNVPVFDRNTGKMTNWNDLYSDKNKYMQYTSGLIFGYNPANSSGCFLNSIVSAVITMIQRYGNVTALQIYSNVAKKLSDKLKDITPSKMKSAGIGVNSSDLVTNYTDLIKNIADTAGDGTGITGTEFANLDGENRAAMVADSISKGVPVILHTNTAFEDNDWSTWASAVFGTNKNGSVRNQHAIMIPSTTYASGSKETFALITDPGSSQLSNGSDPNGAQMRLVPIEYLLGGIMKYKLNHVLAINNNKSAADKSQHNTVNGSNAYKDFVNRYTDEMAANEANADSVLTPDDIGTYSADKYSTKIGIDGGNAADSSSSSSSSTTSGFFDAISQLAEKFTAIGGAVLDALFSGKAFKNPFGDSTGAIDTTPSNGIWMKDNSITDNSVASIDKAFDLTPAINAKGFQASAKDITSIITAAYQYAIANNMPFISSQDEVGTMVVCANALLASKTFNNYRNAYMRSSYVTFCSLSYSEFVYKCLIAVCAYKDAISHVPDKKSLGSLVDGIVDKIVKANPYVAMSPNTYSGTDINQYQPWAVQNSGVVNGFSGFGTPYTSTKLPSKVQQDMLNYIRRMITMSETGSDPDVANPNVNDIYLNPVALSGEDGITLGRAGFYLTNAAEIFGRLSNAPISESDKATAKTFAQRIANGEKSSSFIEQVRNFIRKPSISPYVKYVQDAMSTQFVQAYFNKPLSYYDNGIITDPRSILMGAEFAGVAPSRVPDFYQYLPSRSSTEIGDVRNGMIATAKTFKNWSSYAKGWTNRIDRDYNTMINGGNYPLPQSVIDAIPEDAPAYAGSAGFGLADEMRESSHRIPTSEIYTSNDSYKGTTEPVDVRVDQSPVTSRLDRIITYIENLMKSEPEKAYQSSSGYGNKSDFKSVQELNRKPALNKNDHVPNGTAVDSLRLLHNTIASRTRA